MEVKPGYKRTEIRIIPEDWEVIILNDIVHFYSGKPYESYIIDDGKYNLITLNSITANGNLKSNHHRVNFNDNSLNKGDIIIILSDVAHGKFLGLCDIIPEDNKFVLNQRVGALKIVDAVNPLFLRTAINYNQEYFYKRGQGTSQKNIYKKDLIELKIPVPTRQEQEEIAEVLSDTDELIESLEKMIQKKEAIKKATMQELLKPKNDWLEYKLKDCLDYEQPTKYIETESIDDTSGKVPIITPGKTFILGHSNNTQGIYCDIPIILFDDFTTAIQYVEFPFKVKSSATKILNIKDKRFDLLVIYEIMQLLNFSISDSEHKRRWISEYKNIEIKLPNAKEQAKISGIIEYLNKEIELQKLKLFKYKQIKQGMMQELLTGRIRLL